RQAAVPAEAVGGLQARPAVDAEAGSLRRHGARSIIRLRAAASPVLDMAYMQRYDAPRNTTCRSKHPNSGVPGFSRRQALASQRPHIRRSSILSSACLWIDPPPDG